ncbi:hypothetical protein HPB47_022937 [Ixodes persulcatus]|uniref:Uncharacterized protein n=1 Tax=Ixodes persulcatus TaxID=34615 RepID=A0AC60Q8G3_IXOPE|nr:hypothetical protein HPB47_022937 [Ixodes persulcatus]
MAPRCRQMLECSWVHESFSKADAEICNLCLQLRQSTSQPVQYCYRLTNPGGQNTKRESGRKVQIENVRAAKAVADVIRTCLGPRAMLKMLMNPIGGIIMTNDGNAILREVSLGFSFSAPAFIVVPSCVVWTLGPLCILIVFVSIQEPTNFLERSYVVANITTRLAALRPQSIITVQHPAAKSMIEISRTQDEEVGDGTTSVIILAGELLSAALPFLEQNMHPTVIIAAYRQALEDIVTLLRDKISTPVDVNNEEQMTNVIKSCIGTKMISKWGDLACKIALDAVKTVCVEENGRKEIDIKRYAKVERIPGGSIEESCVLRGVMLNKDVTHPKMKRRIEKPRIVLLDCNLEYKKGESQTNIEILREEDFSKILEIEEQYIQQICADIIKLRPDVVITEKGVSGKANEANVFP